MTSAIFSAINVLTKPLRDPCVRDDQASQRRALSAALRANRAVLLEQLRSDPGMEGARRRRDEAMAAACWFSADTEDAAWGFVQECLLLLLALARHISAELELFNQSPAPATARHRTPEMAPPLPPDVLSVAQQKTLGAALQFVVSLGLCPYLAPGVGVPLSRRSAFGAMVENLVCGGGGVVAAEGGRRLLATTNVLLQLAELSTLATQVFTRHLGDLMAALCQLGYQPPRTEEEKQDLSADERGACRDALRGLMGKVYQPIVIKELLILQGGARQSAAAARSSSPAWLRRLCGRLLSERLVQPNGVQAVVRAVLGGGTGDESDWRKCDGVAKILVTCPQLSASAEDYYRQVCPQMLDLLHFKDKLTALQFQRVATGAVLSMVREKAVFARRHLLAPLLAPLHRCSAIASGEDQTGAAVEEWELTRCVEDVYKVWVVGNSPSDVLLEALEQVLPVVFSLFCFTKHNVSHLRAPCQDILLWYLRSVDASTAVSALKRLSGLRDDDQQVAAELRFSPGADGGARLCPGPSCSDEDDALYEKLSEEQWRLECLVQLLAEAKDWDLPGDFFCRLLQELTEWAAAEGEGREDEPDVSAMTLVEVERRLMGRAARSGRRLALLQVLAVLLETLDHTVLLRRSEQVVDFMVSLLNRACVGLDQDSGSDEGNPIESQTLSMGMGLVATVLSAPQVSAEDYSSMARLLPPLQSLSQLHSDRLVRELASNLSAVIATRGACRPQDPPSDARPTTDPPSAARPSTDPPSAARPSTDPPSSESDKPNRESKDHLRHPAHNSDPSPPTSKPFSDWLLEACDPDVPTRAVALRVLTRMVQNGNAEAVQAQEKVLTLFLENLEHEDSFVYLSAIQGLAVLADSFPERILERLLTDFEQGPRLPTSDGERSLQTRLKVGEVLMRASRAMGELTPHLGRPLVSVFLRGTRDLDPSVRVSSLSNMGELCQRLDYAVGPLVHELSSCLSALIKTEKEAEVRRAAVHVITLLLRGLSDKTTEVLQDVLLDLYRALKWVVRSDPDEVAVLHAGLALDELDAVMRRFLFPEQKLQKKIVVLP